MENIKESKESKWLRQLKECLDNLSDEEVRSILDESKDLGSDIHFANKDADKLICHSIEILNNKVE